MTSPPVHAGPTMRRATPADAEALARGVVDGVEDYRAFAPSGWSPPPLADEIGHTRELLAAGEVWCLIAETPEGVAGQVTVLPAAHAPRAVDDPALAHLRNLFVRRDLWGSGLARTLHAAALEAAHERGFTRMRLFAAAGQGRARRFYERERWRPVGAEFHDPVPGLLLVEYRRALDGARA